MIVALAPALNDQTSSSFTGGKILNKSTPLIECGAQFPLSVEDLHTVCPISLLDHTAKPSQLWLTSEVSAQILKKVWGCVCKTLFSVMFINMNSFSGCELQNIPALGKVQKGDIIVL